MNNWLLWYRRVLGVGMFANVSFLFAVLLMPVPLLEFLHLPLPPLIWPGAVVMLLTVVTVAYIPALIDPLRYRGSAYYTIGARAAGSSYFFIAVLLGNPPGFINLALFDFSFGAIEGVLLYLGLRGASYRHVDAKEHRAPRVAHSEAR